MKITRWQMFIAWLKKRDLLTWYLVIVALLSKNIVRQITAFSIVSVVIQILLTLVFAWYSVKEVFPKHTKNRSIVICITLMFLTLIAIDVLAYIFADNFINLFLLLVYAILDIPLIYMYTKITHSETEK